MLNSRPTLKVAAMLLITNGFIGSAVAGIGSVVPAVRKAPIYWRTDIRRALVEAIDRKRPVVVFFTHSHPGEYHANGKPCYAAKAARDIASSKFDLDGDEAIFIVIEVGRKATADGKTVAKMFNIKSVPAFRVLAPVAGKLQVTRGVNGYFPLPELMVYLRKGLADANYQIFKEKKQINETTPTIGVVYAKAG